MKIHIRPIHIHRVHVRELLGHCAAPLKAVIRREVYAALAVDRKLVSFSTPKDDEAYESDARVVIIPKHRYMNG